MLVYKITNIVNGKVYIGQTKKTTSHRLARHFEKAKAGSQTYLHRAMRKYGFDNFTINPIDTSPQNQEELNECKRALNIKFYYSSRKYPDRFYKL